MSGASDQHGGGAGAWRRVLAGLAALAVVSAVQPVFGQPAGSPAKEAGQRRFEVRVGGTWAAGVSLGDQQALLTRNDVPTGGDVALFTSGTKIAAAPAFDGRLGVALGSEWWLVAGFSYGRPQLRSTITADAEFDGSAVAVDGFDEYVLDGSVVWSPRRWRFAGGRGMPFVLAGAGYLRQLLSDRVVVENGQTYHVGGGTAWGLGRSAGSQPRWGLDAEFRLTWRANGVDLDQGTRVGPRFGAGVFVRF